MNVHDILSIDIPIGINLELLEKELKLRNVKNAK